MLPAFDSSEPSLPPEGRAVLAYPSYAIAAGAAVFYGSSCTGADSGIGAGAQAGGRFLSRHLRRIARVFPEAGGVDR